MQGTELTTESALCLLDCMIKCHFQSKIIAMSLTTQAGSDQRNAEWPSARY